ncbi:MAG: hypothetical protein IBJ11_02305 [Phycisphaerales bacterium]|nr:hypothetical protein [Phycisphaerales bacterium]
MTDLHHPEPSSVTPPPSAVGPIRRRPPQGVVRPILDLFSSVRLGVVLMVVLFVYCTIGSAGLLYPVGANIFDAGSWVHAMPRQWRPFELTEFEWFHTAFFNALCLLICVNLTVATIRRIPLTVLSAGVWMIHSGIIILAAGSVIYFSTKVEGDTVVVRRQLFIDVPGAGPGGGAKTVGLVVLPGNAVDVPAAAGTGGWRFEIASVQPEYELRSGDDAGKKTYAVQVLVEPPIGARFIRQVLDGYPQYTEDVLPGEGRVKKIDRFGGKSLVDESVRIDLGYQPQDSFWVKDSAALHVRTQGERLWHQRPIRGLPRYNDYIDRQQAIWPPAGYDDYPLQPLSIDVSAAANSDAADPLAGVPVRVTGFLRYAAVQPRFEPAPDGAPVTRPVAEVSIRDASHGAAASAHRATLVADDPARRAAFDGSLLFRWVRTADELREFEGSTEPVLTLDVPRDGAEPVRREIRIDPTRTARLASAAQGDQADDRSVPFSQIEGTDVSFRVWDVVTDLTVEVQGEPVTVSLATVDFKTPAGVFRRWVFDDPSRTRDGKPGDTGPTRDSPAPDPRVRATFRPGSLAPATIVAGPGLNAEPGSPAAKLWTRSPRGVLMSRAIRPGERVALAPEVSLTLDRLIPRAAEVSRPMVVPPSQRDRDADVAQTFAMIEVELGSGDAAQRVWLPFHRYSVEDATLIDPGMSRFEPRPVALPGGRVVELMFGRERKRLPAPVVLHDFELATEVGGFTGSTLSIRDWTSRVRFWKGDPARRGADAWTAPEPISVNNPLSRQGLWFFQAYWDAPRPERPGVPASAGLNFTGLGVGNREGVHLQLFGCVLSVAGMIYAFYVKPIIRRRRIERVRASVAAAVAQDRGEVIR